ncbi:hypothetical protein [Caldimonas sp. KR1-144]|uniref:hypothetical protein n=1 Tax=Caldimonas sp. KR1-144 TaxID=3400911 RepID=UPI003C0F8153
MTNQVYHAPVRQVAGRDIFNITQSDAPNYWEWSTEQLQAAERLYRGKLSTARWEMWTSRWLLLMLVGLLGSFALLMVIITNGLTARPEVFFGGIALQAGLVMWPMHHVQRERRLYGRAIRSYLAQLWEIEQVLFERR